jgi:hypothetical protein
MIYPAFSKYIYSHYEVYSPRFSISGILKINKTNALTLRERSYLIATLSTKGSEDKSEM